MFLEIISAFAMVIVGIESFSIGWSWDCRFVPLVHLRNRFLAGYSPAGYSDA